MEQLILNYLKKEILLRGFPPSVREICEAVGLKSTSSVHAHLESLEKNGYIRSVDIAEHLGVTKPSVSNAMKRLREEGYIEMNRSGFITVTTKGMDIADKIYTRHKKLTSYFIALGVDPEIAEEDACRIEHDISDETFDALCRCIESCPAVKKTKKK